MALPRSHTLVSYTLTWQGLAITYHFDRIGQGATSNYRPKYTKPARGQVTKLDEAMTTNLCSMRMPLSTFTIAEPTNL